jgi:chemotaxis protein MotB
MATEPQETDLQEQDTTEVPAGGEAAALPPEDPPAEEAGGGGSSEPECPACEECEECKAGAPAWMATFADMATLLMAFFVLILSFAEMNVPKFKQINGSLKNSFGVQRLIPVVESPKAQSIVAQHFSPSVAQPTPVNTIRQQTTDDRKQEVEVKTDVGPGNDGPQKAAEEVRKALANEVASGQVEVTAENGKVVVRVNAQPSGGGQGATGSSQGGSSRDGANKGAEGSVASNPGGAGPTGRQAAGAATTGQAQAAAAQQGQQSAGQGAQGKQQAGVVSQATIDLYAKIAEAQTKVDAPVQVQAANQGGASGGATGAANKAQTDLEYQRIRKDLTKEIEAGKAEVERDGARIIIRLTEQGSFRSGSADLQPGFSELLTKVGTSVAKTSGRLFIEGHTDNVPVVFNERFRSNWDLSGARAGSVADFMSARTGIAPGRMSVSGYADTRPIDNNDSATGRARNRRIEVIVDGAES